MQTRKLRNVVKSPVGGPSVIAVLPLMSMALYNPVMSQPADDTGVDMRQLEEIIVQAQRRDRDLQMVPVSVTALTADTLRKSGINNTFQLTDAFPALLFSRENSAFKPTIRGIGTRGNSAGDESNVATYIDGVYQPELSNLSFDLLGIERVEVMRGPQGTLFGRNATGGAINVITKKPRHEPEGEAALRVGKLGERSINFYGTTGLGNKLAMDIAALAYDDSGYIDDLVNGGKIDGRESYAIRSKILYEPNDRSELILTVGYTNVDDPSAANQQPLDGNTVARSIDPTVLFPTEKRQSAHDRPMELTSEQFQANLQTKFDFSGFSLETTTSYQDNTTLVEVDGDSTPLLISQVLTNPNSEYISQEVRLVSQSKGAFEWIAGAFLIDGKAGFLPVEIITPTAALHRETRQKIFSWAAFGEATYNITKDLHITGGVRYSYERRKYEGFTALGSPSGPVLSSVSDLRDTFEKVTYRGIIQYDLTERSNVYFSFSRGFKSGVFNAFETAPASAVAVDPEVLDAFEVGLKAEPMPWLRTNFSAFYYDYKDLQISARDESTGLILLQNATTAEVKGVEAEITLRPVERLNLALFATYLDATFDEFPNAQIFEPITVNGVEVGGNTQLIAAAGGNRLIRAPKYTFGVRVDYNYPTKHGTLGLAANLFQSDKYFWDTNNRLFQPSYIKINGEISWTMPDEIWRISIWGENLANEDIFLQMLPSGPGDRVVYDKPITFGLGISATF